MIIYNYKIKSIKSTTGQRGLRDWALENTEIKDWALENTKIKDWALENTKIKDWAL
jgi:hypothetical protein